MEKILSPQETIIVSTLRDMGWHCGREWLSRIKDDRRRITSLNRDYMASKGYEIAAKPCKGAYCGVKDCPLYARRAQKLPIGNSVIPQNTYRELAQRMCIAFDAGKPASQIFAV